MSKPEESEVTRLLGRLEREPGVLERIAALVYDDVRRLAHFQRFDFDNTPTLQTTAVVHEAFLKIFRGDLASVENRAHLMRLMARATRQVIVDHARKRLSHKRGGSAVEVEVDVDQMSGRDMDATRVLDMENALQQLGRVKPELVDLVSARFYAGYSTAELAELNRVSRRTIQRDLKRACAWLKLELGGEARP